MPGVTKEQIEAAKQMTAIEYLGKYRPGELVQGGSYGEFQLRQHDSFKINGETSVWHWKSRDIGGKSALDYLIHVEGMKFVEAVIHLCEKTPTYTPPPSTPAKPKLFVLPAAAKNNDKVIAYLLGRGIDRKVIDFCIQSGILYESKPYHNAVFVGRDENGAARYAALRGIVDYGKPFKMEQAGSEKAYCFCIPPCAVPVKRVAVYEAAIDAMAHLTLEGAMDKYRLSVGGIYAPKDGSGSRQFKLPPALDSFLSRHPEIEEIEVCTDNDFAGSWAASHIIEHYRHQYHMINNPPELSNGDYGNLAEQKMKERAVQKTVLSR